MPEQTDLSNPNCIAHSESIARIEQNTESIRDHLKTLNGSVAKHEARVSELERKMTIQEANDVATAAYRERYEKTKSRVFEDLEDIKTELAEKRGGARGTIGTIREVVSILGVVLMIWMAWSAHQQSVAAKMALQQAIQQQSRKQ